MEKCEVRDEFGNDVIALRFIYVLDRVEILQQLDQRETRLGEGILFFLSSFSLFS